MTTPDPVPYRVIADTLWAHLPASRRASCETLAGRIIEALEAAGYHPVTADRVRSRPRKPKAER